MIATSIGLQYFRTSIASMPKREKLAAIQMRLNRTVDAYSTIAYPADREDAKYDVRELNKMLKKAVVAVAQEQIGVNDRFSASAIGHQVWTLCEAARKETLVSKDIRDDKINRALAAGHILDAFPRSDLTITVE